MPEYIEREALITRLQKVRVTDDVFGMGLQCGTENAINCIKEQPTADVVEVVRCKDCVNYCGFEHCKNGICDRDSVSKWAVYPDDFCSYGERK